MAAPGADLHWLTIAEAGALIRKRTLSPVELTRAALSRIERLNPSLNAFITVTAGQALARAKELEGEQMRGRLRSPLHGIPLGLKDLYDTAGVRTTAASAHFGTRVPAEDAAVVKALHDAGMVMVGKLNMDEFAYNFTSETSHFGAAHNPWKRGYTPGGSSGGSGVAVAAGLCHGALGSDTGGSIRLPAAFCGIAGFKPSYGRLPAHGVLPLAWSLDHVGPMCRTAADCRLMVEVMGQKPLVNRANLRNMRIGVPQSPYWEKVDGETGQLTRAAVDALGRLCSGARDVTPPKLEPASALPIFPVAYLNVISAESFAYHSELIRSNPGAFHPTTRQNIQNGSSVTAAQYIQARQELDRLRGESRTLFREADLLVMPTAPGPAFPLGSRADLIFLRNTAPWNLYGLPSISVPCGFTKDGLPVGLQIVGPAGEDALVLAVAELYEKEAGWAGKHPSL